MGTWTSGDLPQLRDDTAGLCADLDRWGYCLVADALDEAQVRVLRDKILAQAQAERDGGITEFANPVERDDSVNQWVNMLTNKGRVYIDALALNEAIRPLARHVLGTEHLLGAIDSHITWPDNSAMGLHTDQWWMPQPALPDDADYRRAGDITRERQPVGEPDAADRPISPPVVINCFFAITPFTQANGATRLVPGSHRSGRHPDPARSYPEVQPEVPAGTAVVWEGRTWHAAGANRSNGPRVGVSTFFCAPQFRQLTNLTYGTRPEVIAGLDADERRLFGFSTFGGVGNTGALDAETVVGGAEAVGDLSGTRH